MPTELPSPTPVTQPLVFHTMTDGAAAIQEGRLVDRQGCLFLETNEGSSWMVIWPPGYTRDDQAVYHQLVRVAEIGEPIALFGGEYDDESYGHLRPWLNTDVPDRCRAPKYWLTTGMET